MANSTLTILGLFLVGLLLSYGNLRWNSPLLALVNRWLRWILGSLLVAGLVTDLGWSGRPFWLLALTAFLGWFLIETLYNYAIISALSRSPIPLFPRFQKNSDGDEWPATKAFILLRDWLRSQGFRKLQSVKARLDDLVAIRSSIYQNEDGSIRCQVLFFPARSAHYAAAYVLSTQTQEGELVITDNVYLPFGGYYPENWFIERRPLTRSLCGLMRYHRRRLQRDGVNIKPWDCDEPVDELNRQQSVLEKINLRNGFLHTADQHEERGRITSEGRYRLWKEIWLLNYFGIAVSD